MLNNGICAICKTNKWTILCPECSRPLCSDCVKDLDGYHRCERCLSKDLKRGEQYSRAVYTVLKDERTKEQFGNLFWDMAAKNADPHLFFEESDERVVKTLIYNHNFDEECVERWLDNPNSQIRVQAALLTEDGKVDEVLARLDSQDVAHVLACKPQWATRERVMNAWENADEVGRYKLVKVMRDMPDSFINQVFKSDAYMALHDRLEEYREAVRQVLELGAMFSEDSEIRRKIWERAEREI